MSGPSSLSVAFDFDAASRKACRSALPIAGNSRSMIYLCMDHPPVLAAADGGRSAGPGKARHHLPAEELSQGQRRIEPSTWDEMIVHHSGTTAFLQRWERIRLRQQYSPCREDAAGSEPVKVSVLLPVANREGPDWLIKNW